MLKGKMTIAAPYGSGADYIHIEFADHSSGTRFLVATMSYKEFMAALVGRGDRPCEFELATDYVGLVRQNKKGLVFIADGEWATRDERAAEAVKPLEVDGWMGRAQDALNHHRLVKREGQGAWYSAVFIRYVEPDEAPNPN